MHYRRTSFFSFLILLFLCLIDCNPGWKRNSRPIAILGAFADEIGILQGKAQNVKILNINGINVTRGSLHGKDVVLAYTGIGKVNAAMTTTLIIDRFDPSLVIFTGIAGALNPDLKPTDIIISEKCVQHDLNYVYDDSLVSYPITNPSTGKENPVFFEADQELLHYLKLHVSDIHLKEYETEGQLYHPKVLFGIIATGDAFIASGKKKEELIYRFQADAVEMEGAAVAQVCYQHHIPFIIIRSISDSADQNAEIDIETFLSIAAENATIVVLKVLDDNE